MVGYTFNSIMNDIYSSITIELFNTDYWVLPDLINIAICRPISEYIDSSIVRVYSNGNTSSDFINEFHHLEIYDIGAGDL